MHESENSYYSDPEFLNILARYENIERQGFCGYMDSDDLADVADYYYTTHHRQQGDRCIEFAMRLHPRAANILTFKARSLMMRQCYDEAAALLDAADDQNNRELVYLRAELLIVGGKRRAAEALLQQHLPDNIEDDEPDDEFPDDSDDTPTRSYIREVIGLWLDYDDTHYASLWTDRLRQQPDLQSRDIIMLADYANAAGQGQAARVMLQGIVESDPYNVVAWNMLAEVCYDDEDYEEAYEACEMVLAIDAGDYQATTTLLHIYYAQGNTAEIEKLAATARQLWPEDDICPLYEGMAHVWRYSQGECPDQECLNKAYRCLEEAERKAGGQSVEQANIIIFMAYVMAELYYNAPTDNLREEYRQRTIDYARSCRSFGRECNQVAIQLGNTLINMGELQLASELLKNT